MLYWVETSANTIKIIKKKKKDDEYSWMFTFNIIRFNLFNI